MRAHSHGGWFVICLDNLSGTAEEKLGEILAKEKLNPAIPMTGMAGDILPLEVPVHPTLRLVRITDEKAIKDLEDLNCIAYNLSVKLGV
jgi:hypothetical protein